MLPIPTTRAEQSRRYLEIRQAFGLTDDNPTNSEEAVKAGIAEAISHHANGVDFFLAEIFTLTNSVMAHRDEVAGPNPAIYDLRSLSVVAGSSELALLACKLCGAYYHHPNKWKDDGDGFGRPVVVEFSNNFYTNYLNEWSE